MTDPESADRPPVIIDSISPDLLNTRPCNPRVMTAVNWIRMNDDLLERSSAFVDDEGNVTISAAQYSAIMSEAGWKRR